jgi:hypothetical protein
MNGINADGERSVRFFPSVVPGRALIFCDRYARSSFADRIQPCVRVSVLWRDSFRRGYGRADVIREYAEVEASYVHDLRPVIAVLRDLYPAAAERIAKKHAPAETPLKEIGIGLDVDEVSTSETREYSPVSISLMTHPTLAAALWEIQGRRVILPVRFERDTFSGRQIGEAAYSWYLDAHGATLFFVRRNVSAILHYRPRTTASIETRRISRTTPDPTVKQKIEELARRLDDELKVLK